MKIAHPRAHPSTTQHSVSVHEVTGALLGAWLNLAPRPQALAYALTPPSLPGHASHGVSCLGHCPLPAMGLPGHSVQDVCAVPSRLWCVRREPRSCACGAGAALPALTMTTRVCPQFLRHAPRSPSDSRLPGCQSRSPGPPSCAEQALPSGCRLRGAGRPAPRFCPGPAASAVGRRSEPRTHAFVFPPARRWLEQRKGASGTSFPRGDAFQKRGKGL